MPSLQELLHHSLTQVRLRRVIVFEVPYTPAECETLLREHYGSLIPSDAPIWPPVRLLLEGKTSRNGGLSLRFRSPGSTMTAAFFTADITPARAGASQITFTSESSPFAWYAIIMGAFTIVVVLAFITFMLLSALLIAAILIGSILVVRSDITEKQVNGLYEFQAILTPKPG